MNNESQNIKFSKIFTFELIKTSLNNLIEKNKSNKDENSKESKKLILKINVDNLINFSQKFENLYNICYNKNPKSFRIFKRRINHLIKLLINKKDIKFKKYNNICDEEKKLFIIIALMKIFINEDSKFKIKKLLLFLIKSSTEKEIFYEIFFLIIELLLNIFVNILQTNKQNFYSINEEPFCLIEDIINAIISYPELIEIKDPNKYIIGNIIDLFDNYLFLPNHPNINLNQCTLWLKLLENHMFIPVNQNEIINMNNYIDANINKRLEIQDKLLDFLTKIYKFSMRNNYMENILFKNGILNLNYYIISLNFLEKLFWDEINSIEISEFKIKEGIFLPKNKYLFFNKIEPKTNELSMIFSFKICNFNFEDGVIDVLEICDKKMKNILKLSVDEKGILILENEDKKKNDTDIIIKEKTSYILCLSLNKKFIGYDIELFINSSKKKDSNKINKNNKEKKTPNFTCKLNNYDPNKEISLALGKKNFIGVIGEFIIINKSLKSENINYLFNLRENYANLLCKYYYDYKIPLDGTTTKKTEHYYFKTDIFKESIEYFKKLGYSIIFEYMSNDINRFMKPINIFPIIDIISETEKKKINSITPSSNYSEEISKIKNMDFFESKNNILVFKNLSKMNYSYSLFSKNNGMDFLSFQLYNIFSKINDIELLNIYLSETLYFIMQLLNYQTNIYKDSSGNIETKITIFLLTLLILLTDKNDKFYLNDNNIDKLIEIFKYFQSFKLINERNIILSILLNISFYKKKEDIIKFQQIFDQLKIILEEKNQDHLSLFNREILYNLLILDFLMESVQVKHKTITQLISDFVSINDPQKDNLIPKEFISYVFRLKSEIKIYHYLRIIYFNFNIFVDILKDNKQLDFLTAIKENLEKIEPNHCKYCSYNQILFYLINEEINQAINEKESKYHFNITGFMRNPSYFYIRCFFSQIFSLSNKDRFKFIKSKTIEDPNEFVFSLNEKNEIDIDFPKIEDKLIYILEYINFLKEQKEKKELSEKIIYLLELIMDFLIRISQSQYALIESELNFINKVTPNKKNKKNNNEKEKNNNLNEKKSKIYFQKLFTSKFITNFFKINLKMKNKMVLEKLKYLVKISIKYAFYPFYFHFINESDVLNNDTNDDNINKNKKFQLFNIIGENIILYKINYDINKESNLLQNNILLLLYWYDYIINGNEKINPEFEEILFVFLKHLINNKFYNSKYIFDINFLEGKPDKNRKSEKKFLLEMIFDIYFHLYDNSNYDTRYKDLISKLFFESNINLANIDAQSIIEHKNKEKEYIFFNQNNLNNIANGEETKDILYLIFFLIYFIEKHYYYKKIFEENNAENLKETIDLLNKIMQTLFDNIIQFLKQYNKKINYFWKNKIKKTKNKIYTEFLEFIASKLKKCTLDSAISLYSKLASKTEKIHKKSDIGYNSDNKVLNNYSSSKKVCNLDDSLTARVSSNTIKECKNQHIIFPKIEVKERKNSISYDSEQKETFYKTFTETDSQTSQSEKNSININETPSDKKESNIQNYNGITKKLFDRNEYPNKLENIINIEDTSNEDYLKNKLNEINIPWRHFRKIFRSSNSNVMEQLFNPKEFYIWNKFIIILKDFIFSSKKFDYVSKLYKMKYRKYQIIKSSQLKNRQFSLKYPSKIKNFICDDYYRPFTKPNLNFFNNKLLNVTHHYLNDKFLKENIFEIDKISRIKFPRLIPINDESAKSWNVECELINDNGCYYGEIYVNHFFLLFVSQSDKDPRKVGKKKKYENEEEEEKYLYSYSLDERITDKKKYVIIYLNEVKEVLVRRVCLNYIGYEFFMKNNKSYFFNFFNKKFFSTFLYLIINKTGQNNPKNDKKNNNHIDASHVSAPIYEVIVDEGNKFPVIKDLPDYFEKNEFRIKHYKGELSNFKYLLLLNKFSSRTYNDLLQYSVFPLLYLDIKRTKERDLSKVLALNKPPSQEEHIIELAKNNYSTFKYHFNSHYSTSGFVLYYLVRIDPFTSGQIKLQSGQFDAPKRMFSNFENYLLAINTSEENRELTPEFFANYEIFLNLNYLNLGYMKEDDLIIGDLDTGDKNGIAEFIINMRKNLEKVNILPWVDNVFGANQDYIDEEGTIINLFSRSSYEQFYNYEQMKVELKKKGKNKSEIINIIKDQINILSLGITPIKIFKTCSKKRNMSKMISSRISSKANIKKPNESNYLKEIKNFVNSNLSQDSKIFVIEDVNNCGKKLVIKTKKELQMLNIFNENRGIIKMELRNKKLIDLHPISKFFCELSPGVFLICRYVDKTMHLISDKNSILIKYKHTITSLEFVSYECVNGVRYKNKVIFGDEVGNINLLLIDYEIGGRKLINFNHITITKIAKAHNSYIQGILFVKRLNIIISYSEEGQIVINNAFDFKFINIIDVGENFYINDIKISEYDLIYVYCTNKENEFDYIKCYSLNGLKFTELKTEKKIINFFVYETLVVVYENNLIQIFNLYDIDGEPLNQIEPGICKKGQIDEIKKGNKNKKIIYSFVIDADKKLIIIYDNNHIEIEDILIYVSSF